MKEVGQMPLWVEGEKIPDERIRTIFRQPPEVPSTFYRSALVIGSRGAGKTTLFRYQKSGHEGLAIHISLMTELAPIGRELGLGPLSYDVTPAVENLILGKTTALLALAVAERLAQAGVVVDLEYLKPCLPKQLRSDIRRADTRAFQTVRKMAGIEPLSSFVDLLPFRPLSSFVAEQGTALVQAERPMLLLLDRADMVPPPCLIPVLELLDQSTHYVALVAMRPGYVGGSLAASTGAVVAGDHFGVVHLGTSPRSESWASFLLDAVRAQLGPSIDEVSSEVGDAIAVLSRDSLRTALELYARCQQARSGQRYEALTSAAQDLHEQQFTAAQHSLQHLANFREIIRRVRGEATQASKAVAGPILLNVERKSLSDLFDSHAKLDRMIGVGLRCGAFACQRERVGFRD